ncbi:hypothetical protein [Mycobacterium shinjukuense]|uniref:Uncharacterized protein n=1 Tax=Mycobacterium shinjukuense TaxID=398694 RepID=A0A7I7MMR5_9MYCO|nr:hypothetical protein [Mycobacterium shinjukuense]ORB71102.1 hypothetical protein BST45_03705 [Mycobacterium shinjukuense]BBX73544.1 hypothetical protein MSHI_14500 [Mycobacterium shinjukuense]
MAGRVSSELESPANLAAGIIEAPRPREWIKSVTVVGAPLATIGAGHDSRDVCYYKAIRGAGVFADSGATAPPLIGAGIEHNRGEIPVAPPRQRLLAQFAVNAPEVASRLAGDIPGRAADAVAAGPADNR